jgi:hypothetical protein
VLPLLRVRGWPSGATSSSRRRTRTSARRLPAASAQGQPAEALAVLVHRPPAPADPRLARRRCRTWTRKRIAFYGLSYGGKTAMRVPAIVEATTACRSARPTSTSGSGRTCRSTLAVQLHVDRRVRDVRVRPGQHVQLCGDGRPDRPRPFMVERGHDDGVGTDEMVAYEYAKVRFAHSHDDIHLRDEFRFHPPQRLAVQPRPGGVVVHAVVHPPGCPHPADEVRHDWQRGDDHRLRAGFGHPQQGPGQQSAVEPAAQVRRGTTATSGG